MEEKMNSKRVINLSLILIMVLCCLSFNVSAKDVTVTVTIPDYQIIIDDASVYYADSLYPFLNYKGVTYLPMTYQYARAMNLTTDWLEGSAFMVAFQPSDVKLPKYQTTSNKKNNTAVVPTGYNIYVNAQKIDNSKAEYPLLNFRGVTYFPLTWEYAVESFGWQLSFENKVLKINTERNTAYRWTLEEKKSDSAVLSLYYEKAIPSGNGNVSYDYITEYYNLDYKTGDMSKLRDYTLSEENYAKNKELEVTVDNGYVYYDGIKLEGIYVKEASKDYKKPDDVEKTEYTVTASTSSAYAPLDVINVSVYVYNEGKGPTWGNFQNYTFVKTNGKCIPFGTNKRVENVYELNGNIYFNTHDYVQTIHSHTLQNRKMWKLSAEGSLTEITYPEYNSIKIIGKANNKLYLKCLWSPENPMEESPYSVSLINDGYHTFDGNGIKLISPYIYSDFDVVSNNGTIFAFDNISDKITKCKINAEYY